MTRRAEVFAVLNRPEKEDQWWPSMVVERVCKPILNALGYVAEPLFRMSHEHVMRKGEASLRACCERTLARDLAALVVDSASPHRAGGAI